MEIKIKTDAGDIVIIEDQCYMYTESDEGDTHKLWADLSKKERMEIDELINRVERFMSYSN